MTYFAALDLYLPLRKFLPNIAQPHLEKISFIFARLLNTLLLSIPPMLLSFVVIAAVVA